jgi:anti-anti-sigma factor
MANRLQVRKERHDDRTWIYTLAGDLYGNSEGYAFQDEVRAEVQAGCRRIVVDLAGVGRIDSSGVGILVAMMFSASNAGGALCLVALSDKVEKVLGIAMLLDHIAHAPSVPEALAKLG